MALTPISGFTGSVTLPSGHAIKCTDWTLSIGQMVYDTTGFGDSWTDGIGGLKTASGQVTGRLQYDASSSAPGAASPSATGGSFTLTVVTGCTYTFTGLITGFDMLSDIYDTANKTCRISFVSKGAVSETWDQTG